MFATMIATIIFSGSILQRVISHSFWETDARSVTPAFAMTPRDFAGRRRKGY